MNYQLSLDHADLTALVSMGPSARRMLPYPHGIGSHAEYVTGPTRVFALKPGTID